MKSPMLVAAVLTAAMAALPCGAQSPPGTVAVPVEVVDADGHALEGAEIVAEFRYPRGSDPLEMTVVQARSDPQGRARLEAPREHSGVSVYGAQVSVHRRGLSLARGSVLLLQGPPDAPLRLTLGRPTPRTLTVLGPGDRPMAGLRITPVKLRSPVLARKGPVLVGGRSDIPDAWLDRFTATTDTRGVAEVDAFGAAVEVLAVRIAGAGIATHTRPLEVPQANAMVLRLGGPGRLVGIVRSEAGKPLGEVPVEVWVRGSGTMPGTLPNFLIVEDQVLAMEAGPLKTGPQGAFQTPRVLVGGSTYRVSIRAPGFEPYVSGWVKLDGERTTIPDIRLRPVAQVSGIIRDRKGQAVAGARVFEAGGGPSTTTDAEGRFTLPGVHRGKTVILYERPGFRLRGRVVDPSAAADLGTIALIRDEDPGPPLKPLPDVIPLEEGRALAARVLEPYLREDPPFPDLNARLAAIRSLALSDLDRALDLLQNGKFPEADSSYQFAREVLAALLARTDPVSAQAMAESLPEPYRKFEALIEVARALPASERARKRELAERAAFVLRNELKQAKGRIGLRYLTPLARLWLELGDRDRARPLIEEGTTILDSLPPANAGLHYEFLEQLARYAPGQALERLRKAPTVAPEAIVAIANEHPAEAERLFNAAAEIPRLDWQRNFQALRLARRLARVAPEVARRFAASRRRQSERAMAWAYVALGLAESKRPGATEAVDQAIREIDRLRQSGPGPELVMILSDVLLMYPTNPAAPILPVVERAVPDRLAEVFWRAVALHPRIDPDDPRQLQVSYIGYECMLLARYDREIADVLLQPAEAQVRSLARQKGTMLGFNSRYLMAKGCIDPRAAVALVESLALPGGEFRPINPVHGSRLVLAEVLGLPTEERWKRVYRSMLTQLPIDDE